MKEDMGEIFGIGSNPMLNFMISMLGVEMTGPIPG
jgi:hypothetical protein